MYRDEWWISDPHFWHKNVIAKCNRPYSSVEEMNEDYIEIWNKIIRPGAKVNVLGDVALCGVKKIEPIIKRLNGHKTLVMGNHDWRIKPGRWGLMGFDEVITGNTETTIGGRKVMVSHYPYPPKWYDNLNPFQRYDVRYLERRLEDLGYWLVHGHVHHAWKRKRRMINVGWDIWGRPVHADVLACIMNKYERSPLRYLERRDKKVYRGL